MVGRWEYVQRQDTHYHPDGTVDWVGAVFKPTPGSVVITITADSMITRREQNGGAVVTYVHEGYTRRGNVVDLTEKDGSGGIYRSQLLLDELAEHRLRYHYDEAYPTSAGGKTEFRTNVEYTR